MIDTKPIPRVELPQSRWELPPYKPGHWILAGTPGDEPYPCTCRYDPCRYERCPDRTRADRERVADRLPSGCCGRPDAATVRPRGPRKAAEGAGGHSGRDAGGSGAPRGSRTVSAARGSQVAEDDLWGAPIEALPSWDGLDEASPVHGDGLEAFVAYANGPAGGQSLPVAAKALPEAIPDQLGAARQRVRDAQCDCRTPWDADPPALLVAEDAKDGTPIGLHRPLSTKPGADVRAEADEILAARGLGRSKPWRSARHALLPGVRNIKTRECWTAPLVRSGVAVIDLPPAPVGGGIHCGECCRHFQNSGAWELHRPKSKNTCIDPACVMLVPRVMLGTKCLNSDDTPRAGSTQIDHPVPLLKRSIGGIWTIDPLAVWGSEGPPMAPAEAQTIWSQAQRKLSAARWRFGRGHNRS